MAVPAGVYAALNCGDPVALDGWGIPVATDIAFALALVGVFGRRVPTAFRPVRIPQRPLQQLPELLEIDGLFNTSSGSPVFDSRAR